jgi:hypothetical protein
MISGPDYEVQSRRLDVEKGCLRQLRRLRWALV